MSDSSPIERSARLPQPLALRIAKQVERYGGFEPTLPGLRLAVACLEDEVAEVRDAWRAERRGPGGWSQTYDELLDVAAVAIRALAAIDEAQR